MPDTPAQRKAKRAWETRQRELDPEGFKQRQREAQKRYQERHKESLSKRRKERRLANLEQERARGRDEYARNREARKATARAWKERNPEHVKQYRKRVANLRRYDLTWEQREAMFEAQGRKCASCGSLTPRNKNDWHIDHCHKTGKVRGILCLPCNVALAKVNDSVEHLKQLITYIEAHNDHD